MNGDCHILLFDSGRGRRCRGYGGPGGLIQIRCTSD